VKVRVVVVVVPVHGAGGVGGALASPFGDGGDDELYSPATMKNARLDHLAKERPSQDDAAMLYPMIHTAGSFFRDKNALPQHIYSFQMNKETFFTTCTGFEL
jgi:hypothetical protein